MQILQLDARALIFGAALFALAAPADAFDCAKASSKYEKAICADPSRMPTCDGNAQGLALIIAKLPRTCSNWTSVSVPAWLTML